MTDHEIELKKAEQLAAIMDIGYKLGGMSEQTFVKKLNEEEE